MWDGYLVVRAPRRCGPPSLRACTLGTQRGSYHHEVGTVGPTLVDLCPADAPGLARLRRARPEAPAGYGSTSVGPMVNSATPLITFVLLYMDRILESTVSASISPSAKFCHAKFFSNQNGFLMLFRNVVTDRRPGSGVGQVFRR